MQMTKLNKLQNHPYSPYHIEPHHPSPQYLGPEAPYVPVHESDPYYIEPILTHHHLKEYKPYHYDISKTPDCAYINKRYYNLTFCLQDEKYPV